MKDDKSHNLSALSSKVLLPNYLRIWLNLCNYIATLVRLQNLVIFKPSNAICVNIRSHMATPQYPKFYNTPEDYKSVEQLVGIYSQSLSKDVCY